MSTSYLLWPKCFEYAWNGNGHRNPFEYKDVFRYEVKTIVRPSYFNDGNFYTGKTFYVETARAVSSINAEHWHECYRDAVVLTTNTLQWRHNERDGVSNHRRPHCLLYYSFRRRSKKTSKFRFTGLCAGNSPVTGEFPAQRASNAENVSIWWRHHE